MASSKVMSRVFRNRQTEGGMNESAGIAVGGRDKVSRETNWFKEESGRRLLGMIIRQVS